MCLLYLSSPSLRRAVVTAAPFSISRVTAAFASSASASADSIPNKLLNCAPESLNNEYWVLRHGQSKANVAKVIASSPIIAKQKYGLSEVGNVQAAQAGEAVIQAFEASQRASLLLLSSDLLRAKETAEIVQQTVQQAGIPLYENPSITTTSIQAGLAMEPRLRERWFGEWDGTSDEHYPNVWKDDVVDPNHTLRGVESVNQVVQRTTECIVEWDDLVRDCFVICVAHGDVLQILQTAFAKMDGAQHRSLDHLDTATLRKIELAE